MNIVLGFWNFLLISAPLLLVGLLFAGVIHSWISVERIKKSLGKESFKNVVKAALFGIPLPLCSCAVIPSAVTLKKSGAGNAAVSSFLVSTPESGVDSIAMTYAMMDFPMTLFRPVAALASAMVAGGMQLIFNPSSEEEVQEETQEIIDSCCDDGHKHHHSHETKPKSKFKTMFTFAFGDLIDDIALWLGMGLIVGALLQIMLPPDFFTDLQGWQTKVLVLFIGLPVYICASATTPIAAAMMLKGMSPGSALILLLVGPATNIFNMMVLQKYIGKKGVAINLVSIAVVALIFSFIVDASYSYFQWPMNFQIDGVEHKHTDAHWWESLSAALLLILIVKGIIKKEIIERSRGGHSH